MKKKRSAKTIEATTEPKKVNVKTNQKASEDKFYDEKPRLIDIDPWLTPYENDIKNRRNRFLSTKKEMLKNYGSFKNFASGHLYFGIHETEEGWFYREWAPGACQLYFIGDFNSWNRSSHPMKNIGNGVWEIFLARKEYEVRFTHGSFVKVHVVSPSGWQQVKGQDRIPLYMRRVVQRSGTVDYVGQLWFPKEPFVWTDSKFLEQNSEGDAATSPTSNKRAIPLIYEAHIGMAQEKEGIGTYREFADQTLPRIKELGYNCIQLMGIMEHPYYGSFGYHVSNYFAASSRFGTPEDLKYLVNKAHEEGFSVLLDIVHSHAVRNTNEGINQFDGTDYQFFHVGEKGDHIAWDSKLFNYNKMEVCHFLLSNIRFWLEEYHFDGFRFDGVTSMLYHHHGLGHAFDHYGKYFSMDTDVDAVHYLQMANAVAREVRPQTLTIAEDMSGMPGMCLPIEDGGLGFDYRLSMGIPDMWIRLLKTQKDEDWNMDSFWHELVSRRPQEKNIGYVESHDQALVGDKTIAFWLMDAAMYWHMSETDQNIVIDRGLALHKMIRLITLSLGCEGYLNFMGNEFGHPEWIDFPREGNGWSYKHSRRQWHLVDDKKLKYKYLNDFDKGMIRLTKGSQLLGAHDLQQLWIDNEKKLLIFKKAGLVFVFNFHPHHSLVDFEFYLPEAGDYKIIFNTDGSDFGGHGRLDEKCLYSTYPRQSPNKGLENSSLKQTMNPPNPPHALRVYSPCRCAFVLARVKK